MKNIHDITGQQFGKLRAVSFHGRQASSGNALWRCVCECGNEKICILSELRKNAVRSCGCLARSLHSNRMAQMKKTHGHTALGKLPPEYSAWRSMKQRCTNPNHKQWKDYGGRGITVCVEWMNSFEDFLSHVGPKPNADLTLDRIDNNGNYEPGNLRWADRTTQTRNRRPVSAKGASA